MNAKPAKPQPESQPPSRPAPLTARPRRAGDPAPAFAVGDIVMDEQRGQVGQVMDRLGGGLQLRPVRGGREWDADPGWVRPATSAERLSATVAAANAASRGERA